MFLVEERGAAEPSIIGSGARNDSVPKGCGPGAWAADAATGSAEAAMGSVVSSPSSISSSTSMISVALPSRGGVLPRKREVLFISRILASTSPCVLAMVATIPPTCAPTNAFRSLACSWTVINFSLTHSTRLSNWVSIRSKVAEYSLSLMLHSFSR